jgi:ParB family chromosome partitioning protein
MANEEQIHVKLAELHPNPYQPPNRLKLTEEEARKGGMSVLEDGLFYLPIVRPIEKNGQVTYFEVFDGWQRHEWFAWLARNGHPEYGSMPVTLRSYTDEEMAEKAWKVNEERKNYTVIDLAWSYRKYLADFKNVTQTEFAKRRGISQGEIANTIRLLDLPEQVQQMIISHEISESHGRALLALKEDEIILVFACNTKEAGWSVAELDRQIKGYLDKQKPKLVETPPAPPVQPPPPPPVEEKKEIAETLDKAAAVIQSAASSPAGPKPTEKKETEAAGKKPEPKKQTPAPAKPAAPAAPPAPPKPTWKRKLVIEEQDKDIVKISMMAENKLAVKGIKGNLEDALPQLGDVIAEIMANWQKEED